MVNEVEGVEGEDEWRIDVADEGEGGVEIDLLTNEVWRTWPNGKE